MAIFIDKNNFKPQSQDIECLSSIQINDIMHYYELLCKDFKFLGAVPIDFDNLPCYGIKDLAFNKLKEKNKNRIGIVINLDESHQHGSHWVSLFFDINKVEIYFYDSYGNEPEIRICNFIERIRQFIKNNLHKNPIIDFNKTQFEYDNYSHEINSIKFLSGLLKGINFVELTSKSLLTNII